MGLNMHIRNEFGKVIRAEELSVVSAYRQHESVYTKIKNNNFLTNEYDKFGILISINPNLEFKTTYNSEFIMYLINAKTNEIISESLTLYWLRLFKKFKHDYCKALFGELTKKELHLDTIALKVVMLKQAPIEIISNNGGKKCEQMSSYEVRQPYAKGQVNISEAVRDIMDKEKRELLFNLTRLDNEKSTNTNMLGKNGIKELSSFEKKIPITITVQLINGCLKQIQEENPDIFLTNSPAILQPLISDVKYTLDFR